MTVQTRAQAKKAIIQQAMQKEKLRANLLCLYNDINGYAKAVGMLQRELYLKARQYRQLCVERLKIGDTNPCVQCNSEQLRHSRRATSGISVVAPICDDEGFSYYDEDYENVLYCCADCGRPSLQGYFYTTNCCGESICDTYYL